MEFSHYLNRRKKMKKFFVFALTAAVLLALAGCGTTEAVTLPPSQPAVLAPVGLGGGVPEFINEAYINASEDVLIGIGTYKIGADVSKMSTGMTFAQTRARADIARQLQSIIKNMITDYTATSELDPDASLSFQESVTQALAKADLKGAKVVKQQTDSNGLLWVVMEYSKSAAANDYSAATAAAKLAVPAAAAFDATARMDNAFDKAAGGGPIPVGD
jgi:predicted small lipoprotein YifL